VASPLSHPERHRHFLVLRVDVTPSDISEESLLNGKQTDR
jgi:rod shape-determining protein MreC